MLYLTMYADVLPALNDNQRPLPGFMIIFGNDKMSCKIHHNESRKLNPIETFIMGGALYEYIGTFDSVLALNSDLSHSCSLKRVLDMLTDSK